MIARPLKRRLALLIRLALMALWSAVSGACLAQQATKASQVASPQYKGIFEPMNYPDDLSFYSVYFVNDQVGWVSGRGSGGMILHTVDGGQHWTLQLGDPKSSDPEIKDLHFLDATHGWARQAGKLLRTSDGMNWQVIGSYPGDFAQYLFTSPDDGVEAFGPFTGSTIAVTHDAGRSWKNVYQCSTSLQVDGLTRNVSCNINGLSFPSARVGYGVGGSFNDGFSVVAKTEDAGATWRVIFASNQLAPGTTAVFQDENHGVVRLRGGGVIVTADGGSSWQGATGSADGPIFADPRVGLACYSYSCSFTVDGGSHWVSQRLALPTGISAFSLPRRDRAYIVGDHGMIYHYRIVPASYTAKGIVDAPLMPAYGGALRSHLDQMNSQVGALQARLSSAAGGVAGTAPVPNGGASTAGGLSQNAPSVQGSSSAQATNFSQDASVAPSAAIQSCCAAQVQDLQSSVGLMGQQVPGFSGEFRDLNLMFVGLNMLADLSSKAVAIHQSFLTLKQAPNLQAALAALQSLSAQISGTSQAIDSDFQSLSAVNSAAGSANSFSNMAGGASGAIAGGTAGGGAPGPAPPQSTGPVPNGSASPPSVDSASDAAQKASDAAQKAKDTLNKLMHF